MFLPWKHLMRFLKPDYKWTHERGNNFISQLDSSCTNLGIDGSFIAAGKVRWVLGASIKLKFLVILRYEDWLIIFYCWLFFIENFTTFCCSVAQLCPTLHNPMKCSTLGLPVSHHLLEFAQVHAHCVSDATQPYHPSSVALFSFCLQFFPASGSFQMSQLFVSGDQNIGASASVLPMSIQGWFLLRLTYLISLLSEGLQSQFNLCYGTLKQLKSI